MKFLISVCMKIKTRLFTFDHVKMMLISDQFNWRKIINSQFLSCDSKDFFFSVPLDRIKTLLSVVLIDLFTICVKWLSLISLYTEAIWIWSEEIIYKTILKTLYFDMFCWSKSIISKMDFWMLYDLWNMPKYEFYKLY